MKAELPGARLVKYGLPACEQGNLVEQHFAIMREQKLFAEQRFVHALRVGPGLRAALDGLSGKGAAPGSATEEATVEVVVAPVARTEIELRAALGLR